MATKDHKRRLIFLYQGYIFKVNRSHSDYRAGKKGTQGVGSYYSTRVTSLKSVEATSITGMATKDQTEKACLPLIR